MVSKTYSPAQACAFVVFPDSYSAQLAIRTLNKTPWHSAPDAPPIIVPLRLIFTLYIVINSARWRSLHISAHH